MIGMTLEGIGLTHAQHRVFDHLSIEFEGGKWHSVQGRSGVGKTSLLRLIAGLQQPDSGHLRSLDEKSRSRKIAYVPQEDSLLPWLNALDNVLLGPRLRGNTVKRSIRTRALELLEQVGLAAWAHALPSKLSGGMRQRVALARTLLEDPPMVLMDEPYSRLDAITRHELQNLSFELLRGRTVILVTHDPSEALRLSHKVHVIQPGAPTTCNTFDVQEPPPRNMDSLIIAQHLPELWALLQVDRSVLCVDGPT